MAKKGNGASDALPKGLSDEAKAEVGFEEAETELGAEAEVDAETEGAQEATEKPADGQIQDKAVEGQPEQPQAPVEPLAGQPQPTDPAQDQRQRMVPHEAMHEAREQAKEYRRLYEQSMQQSAAQAEQLAMVRQWMESQWQAMQPQPAPPPDPNEDPFGYIAHAGQQIQQQQQAYEQLQQQIYEVQQERQMESYKQQLVSTHNSDASAFKAQAPDYDQALAYLVRQHEGQLLVLNGIDPSQATMQQRQMAGQQIYADFLALVDQAVQRGVSPAQFIYNFARLRGYQSPQPQQAQAQAPAAQGNGVDPVVSEAARKLANVKQSQAQNKSLTGVGQASPPTEETLTDVADMDDGEFEAFMRKGGSKKLQRLSLNS